jgi:ABC-type polysaccharide transport system permease subunit
MLDAVGLKSLFAPWLGKEAYALVTLSLISVWQFVGIPMMLIYAALLSIPEEILEAGEIDGITGINAFWKIKLPLILPSIGIISILTFVGNFRARWRGLISRPIFWAPSFIAPSSVSSCNWGIPIWARRLPGPCLRSF